MPRIRSFSPTPGEHSNVPVASFLSRFGRPTKWPISVWSSPEAVIELFRLLMVTDALEGR